MLTKSFFLKCKKIGFNMMYINMIATWIVGNIELEANKFTRKYKNSNDWNINYKKNAN
jgi:hypothetical protein